jgi:hypothetical protein
MPVVLLTAEYAEFFYPQMPQILFFGGGLTFFLRNLRIDRCYLSSLEDFFIHRLRRLTQIFFVVQVSLAACLAAARQATPPVGRRERGGGRSVPRGLPRGYFFSREGAKKKARKIFSHAKARKREEDREDGGMSCRCASSHAIGGGFIFRRF